MADLRSTIYWNPNIITDKDGKASFEYFNADGKGTYRMVIEGIDADGNIRFFIFRLCEVINDNQLLYRLYIKAENIGIKRQVYFFVGLTYPGKNNALFIKTMFNGCFNLVTA